MASHCKQPAKSVKEAVKTVRPKKASAPKAAGKKK
jgi:hypothetical protein